MRSVHPWRLIRAVPVALMIGYASIVSAQGSAKPTKQMTPADLKAWKNIRNATLSNDGKWFAYALAPNEGNAEVVIRSVADGKETRFPIGDANAGGGGRGGFPGGADAGPVQITGDSKYALFTIYPPLANNAGRGGRGAGRGAAPANGAAPA